MESQRALVGDHMEAWRTTLQPALVLRGGDSFMLSAAEAARMERARLGVETVGFPGRGHWLYAEEPDRFAAVIGDFLDRRYKAARRRAAH